MIAARLPRIEIPRSKGVLVFLWLFLLVFPKGGIKLGEVPVTWGYLLLGMVSIFACCRSSWKISCPRIEALFCLLPFQLVSALTILHNGTESIGWAISFFTTFFFLPYAFLLIFSNDIEQMDLNYFFVFLRRGVAFISYYGIFLFIYKQYFGSYFEIPLLTVNLGDAGVLSNSNEKCNSRGIVSKLISTYNNGQLFGIGMTLLLPLYCYVQKNPWHRLATKLAMILTLSRTTWIGLFVHEIFYSLLITKNKKKAFRNLSIMLIAIGAGLAFLALHYHFELSFFFDSNLGGRRGQLEAFERATVFAREPFHGLYEMVYLAILDSFGIIGLITYLIAMGGPILFYLSTTMSKVRLCILLGLINYLFISGSDGATLYIPILAFFWFLISLLGRKDLRESAFFS